MCAPFAVAFAINFTDLRECHASGVAKGVSKQEEGEAHA